LQLEAVGSEQRKSLKQSTFIQKVKGLHQGFILYSDRSCPTRIFHGETGKTMANPCSAGFPACRIAGFQTCVPSLFNHAFERVCAPLFIGVFATHSQMAMKYPGLSSNQMANAKVRRTRSDAEQTCEEPPKREFCW
jgi:hypothetical protein